MFVGEIFVNDSIRLFNIGKYFFFMEGIVSAENRLRILADMMTKDLPE